MNELMTIQSTEIATQGGGFSQDYFSKWIAYLDAPAKTIATYTGAIRQFIRYLCENGITEPTRADILAYKESMQGKYKPTTITNYLAAVRLFFEWTEQEHLYPNISKRIKGVKIDEGHKKDYLNPEQVKRLLGLIDTSTLQGKRDYAILRTMITTGLRTISIANANIEDLRSNGMQTVLYYQGKGHAERTEYVKIEPTTEAAIREYLTARGKADDRQPLFGSLDHKDTDSRLTTRSISRIVKLHLIAAGYNSERYTAHSLRHTAATLSLLAAKKDGVIPYTAIKEAQQMLGHTSKATTEIYAHAIEKADNQAAYRIASLI